MLSFPLAGGGRLGMCVLGPLHQAGSLGAPNMRDKEWIPLWSQHGWFWLIGMVVMGWRLDLMICEVFSNLNDSLILWPSTLFCILASARVTGVFMFDVVSHGMKAGLLPTQARVLVSR